MDTEQCTEACKTLAQPVGFWQVKRAALGALSLGPETKPRSNDTNEPNGGGGEKAEGKVQG